MTMATPSAMPLTASAHCAGWRVRKRRLARNRPSIPAGAPLPAGPNMIAERYLADAERSANLLAGRRSELNEQVREVLAKQAAASADQKAEYEKAYLDLVAARAALEARLQEAQAAADVAKARLRELEAERAKLAPATPPSAPTAPAAPARSRGR